MLVNSDKYMSKTQEMPFNKFQRQLDNDASLKEKYVLNASESLKYPQKKPLARKQVPSQKMDFNFRTSL